MTLRRSITAALAALMSLAMVFGAALSASAVPVLITDIPTGAYPVGVSMSSDGTRVFSVSATGTLYVVDTGTNQVISNYVIPGATNTYAIKASPVSDILYVIESVAGISSVFVIDVSGATPSLTSTITVGRNSKSIAVSPDGTRVYIGNNGSSDNSISVINTASNTVIATVVAPAAPTTANAFLDAPRGLVVSPDGSTLFVSFFDDDASAASVPGLAKMSTSTNSFTQVIEFPTTVHPKGVALTSNGQTLYMANFGTGTNGEQWIERFQASNLTSIDQTPTKTQANAVLKYPGEIALSADNSMLFTSFEPGSGTSGAFNIYSTSNMSVLPTTLIFPGVGNPSWYIAPAKATASHFAYVGSWTNLFLVGEYLSLQRQNITGNTGTAVSSAALTAYGFIGAVTYSIAPSLPAGFVFNTSTGVVSGSSNTAISPALFTITGTDGTTTAIATVTLSVTVPGSSGGGGSSQLANTGNKSQLPIALIGLMFLFAGISVYSGSVALKRRATN